MVYFHFLSFFLWNSWLSRWANHPGDTWDTSNLLSRRASVTAREKWRENSMTRRDERKKREKERREWEREKRGSEIDIGQQNMGEFWRVVSLGKRKREREINWDTAQRTRKINLGNVLDAGERKNEKGRKERRERERSGCCVVYPVADNVYVRDESCLTPSSPETCCPSPKFYVFNPQQNSDSYPPFPISPKASSFSLSLGSLSLFLSVSLCCYLFVFRKCQFPAC